MPVTRKRDRHPTDEGESSSIIEDPESSKRPKIDNPTKVANKDADSISAAKARIRALTMKVAGKSKEEEAMPDMTTASASQITASSAAALMAKIRERKAKIEGLNKSAGGSSVGSEQKEQSVPTGRQPQASSILKSGKQQQQGVTGGRPSSQQISSGRGLGLNTPVHPLLLGTMKDNNSSRLPATTMPIKNRANIYLGETSPSVSSSASPSPLPLSAADQSEISANNPYFDPLVSTKSKFEGRKRRGLAFNPQGKFIKRAEEERRQVQLELLKKKIESRTKAVGILEADILAGERQYKPDPPPEVEWWDEPLVSQPSKYTENIDSDRQHNPNLMSPKTITVYIQHPILISPPWDKHLPKETRLHMTKREIKRMRKNNRAERHKETQDRIRLGLDPAPPPKIKPSNVMSVFANEAIKDPTLMELKAKTEVAQRKLRHEQDNQARKLTSEQHYEKMVAKAEKDKAQGVYCAAFRINVLSDGRHKFLVNYNAKKLHLTGMTIFNPKFCLVVVEGGFLNIKKFTKLMLRRIKWTENATPKPLADSNNGPQQPPPPPPDLSSNKCLLVWHGQLKTSRFQRWTLHDAETEQDAKDILSRLNSEHFWIEARVMTE